MPQRLSLRQGGRALLPIMEVAKLNHSSCVLRTDLLMRSACSLELDVCAPLGLSELQQNTVALAVTPPPPVEHGAVQHLVLAARRTASH
eukprot:scaffold4619_cov222-Isochrysis_galbana.AAC.2